jgi:mandelate racemase
VSSLPLTPRAVRARAVDVPVARPVETAAGVLRSAPLVLIDVETDEGVTGRSYVRTYTPLALTPLADLVENLASVIAGVAATPEEAQDALQRHVRLLGAQGLTGMAIAGIDMALWDACAKARNVPLVTLLGGTPEPIEAYASLRSMSPKAAADEVSVLRTLGFTAFKLKVAGGGESAAIRAVREAAGDGARLMVDYNQSLTVDDAIGRARALDAHELHWIEEPTRADDYAGHARIAAAVKTPIQLGESWWGPQDMEKSIAARASDHVTLDAMKIGGITGWLRAARLAEEAGLPTSSHTFPEISAHLLAVTPTRHLLEYLDHAAPILAQPLEITDGHARIPDRPGIGLEWDEAAVGRYEVIRPLPRASARVPEQAVRRSTPRPRC